MPSVLGQVRPSFYPYQVRTERRAGAFEPAKQLRGQSLVRHGYCLNTEISKDAMVSLRVLANLLD